MIKNSLIYCTEDGKEIRIDDTILNRIKARFRGFKLMHKLEWGKTVKDKVGK